MAALNTVVATLASSFAIRPNTVREQARVLRDAGIIAKQRKGGGQLTTREATNLLLASAGTSRPTRSLFPVEGHALCYSKDPAWDFEFGGLSRVRQLPPDHTLADFIESLICSAIHGDIDSNGLLRTSPRGEAVGNLSLEVSMSEPSVHTEVSVGLSETDEDGVQQRIAVSRRIYKQHFFDKGQIAVPGFNAEAHEFADLKHRHIFTQQVIIDLAQVLQS